MAYLCLFEDTTDTLTRVEVRAVQPEPVVEPPCWISRYVADLGDAEGALLGAQVLMDRMEHEYSGRKRSRGIYAVPYSEVRSWLQRQLDSAEALQHRNTATASVKQCLGRALWVRSLAGAAEFALLVMYVWANVGATFLWLTYLAVTPKERSPLRAMAESAVLFTALDWRRPIHGLVRIALDRK